ncbi:MAG TPA: methyltransferase domain-containing protein [Tepidisphaeraceae bacterium]|jgi:SAM-dependent methyltransferase
MFDVFRALANRHRTQEWMDAPDADPEQLRKSLSFIRQVNTLFRYTRTTLRHLERFSRGWQPGQTIRILDLATGSADVPHAILKWAHKRGFDVRIVGADLHARTLAEAGAEHDPNLMLLRADALHLPFEDASFDYVITSMFLHHLDDSQIVAVLENMNRVASRGIIAADLLRRRRAYFWISIFTLFANPMVRHDARVSVAQALSRAEVLGIRDRAGIGFASYHVHFGHRFVLAGEKPGVNARVVV